MPRCRAESVEWKNRRGYRLSNERLEITVLPGGGHLVDLRLSGSPVNAIWESPWKTIDPHTFSSSTHGALYGDGPVGKLLSGYSGHALALGYFGMPADREAAQGLGLHGEAASSLWSVSAHPNDRLASLTLEVDLPVSRLHFRRQMSLREGASAVRIRETVLNRSDEVQQFQWVEHAAFGEPMLACGDSSIVISATRGRTWPLGYEGHEALPNDEEFVWPSVRLPDGLADLSVPFVRPGTGFVAAALVDPARIQGFVAVHNRRFGLAAGYVFDRGRFPWATLWEENCARRYSPWNGITKVRGVEFGSSPLPLGLQQALETRSLYDTPVFATVPGNSELTTSYEMFLAEVPKEWSAIREVEQANESLTIRSDKNEIVSLPY